MARPRFSSFSFSLLVFSQSKDIQHDSRAVAGTERLPGGHFHLEQKNGFAGKTETRRSSRDVTAASD